MAQELRDFRGRITPEAWAALEADSRASGLDMQVIVRDLLHRWALQKIQKASLLQRLLRAQGITVEVEGGPPLGASAWQDTITSPNELLS